MSHFPPPGPLLLLKRENTDFWVVSTKKDNYKLFPKI